MRLFRNYLEKKYLPKSDFRLTEKQIYIGDDFINTYQHFRLPEVVTLVGFEIIMIAISTHIKKKNKNVFLNYFLYLLEVNTYSTFEQTNSHILFEAKIPFYGLLAKYCLIFLFPPVA